MRKPVGLNIITIDQPKRMVGIIWIDNRNINLEILSEGYTEAFVEYHRAPYRSRFIETK